MNNHPTFSAERKLRNNGCRRIAGVDEVGRGCLAGPILAAAVILPYSSHHTWLSDINDSKLLTAKKREHCFDLICQYAVAVGIGMVWQNDIDRKGIAYANRLSMHRAVTSLFPEPDGLLIDFIRLPDISLPQINITHGDRLSYSIAAASIVAKVSRDRLMRELEDKYRGYGFIRHKGYATDEHVSAIRRLGLSNLHRQTFCKFINPGDTISV